MKDTSHTTTTTPTYRIARHEQETGSTTTTTREWMHEADAQAYADHYQEQAKHNGWNEVYRVVSHP